MSAMFLESVLMAFHSVMHNKLRSFLTMLGIVIGVASVIALMSLGYGMQSDVENRIAALGSNMMAVIPGTGRKPGIRPAAGSEKTLSYEDYLAIKRLPNVTAITSSARTTVVAVNQSKNCTTTLSGVTADYRIVRNWGIDDGRWWSEKEFERRARVCLLGQTTVETLFGDTNPVGEKIRIKGNPFTVIGVLEKKGYGRGDQDDCIICPFSTIQERILGITYLHNIMLTADSAEVVSQLENDIENLLRTRHRLPFGEENDFEIRSAKEYQDIMENTTRTITLFLGSIAAISLLVGGIGIMNIMLVSVTERTREIGIRKALGANYHMIITQFLVESATIGVIGGIIGVVAGIIIAYSVPHFFQIPSVINVASVIGAFVFSVATGIIFGFYPARRAAKLDPIDALRYE